MIVTYLENGFEAVLQRHHAHLAASFMAELTWLTDDVHRVDLILAAAKHDDDYNEFRRSGLLNELGGPRDFKMETFNRQDCERLLEDALAHSRFIAILVAFHIQFVQYDISVEAAKFCDALEATKMQWCKDLGLSLDEMKKYYAMLQWCDALSLLVCQRRIPPEGRALEISKGPDGVPYFISAADEDCYLIDPWPFSTTDFSIRIERRSLAKLTFKRDSELQKMLKESDITIQHLVFSAKK